jgi:hypothetical protein
MPKSKKTSKKMKKQSKSKVKGQALKEDKGSV